MVPSNEPAVTRPPANERERGPLDEARRAPVAPDRSAREPGLSPGVSQKRRRRVAVSLRRGLLRFVRLDPAPLSSAQVETPGSSGEPQGSWRHRQT